ncbi:MAG: FxsA family protein [Arenicella sp.]|nr:FxsA family protein [Arenicella sp.]
MGFYILLLLFVVVPVAEIALLIEIGSDIGVGNTILIVIFTAILGAYLVRQQGFATLTNVQREMNAGRVPAMQLAEGVALLFAGAVLLTPGFLTDALGFALLTPPLRRGLISWVASKGFVQTVSTTTRTDSESRSTVIEGEYRERE